MKRCLNKVSEMKLVIASNNKGKIREYKQLLEPFGYDVVSQREAGIDIEVEDQLRIYFVSVRIIYDVVVISM